MKNTPLPPSRQVARILASAATLVALCLSIAAGWQRGGLMFERLIWIALGIILVLATHWLPAINRSMPRSTRVASRLLWCGCMLATCYGHATFFLLAQRHASMERGASISVVPVAQTESLSNILTRRADIVDALARNEARRCGRDCATLLASRRVLEARLAAIDAASDEARAQQDISQQNDRQRRAATEDPVTSRLAPWLGSSVAVVDLAISLAVSAVLEWIACISWVVALASRDTGLSGKPIHSLVSHANALDGFSSGSHDSALLGHESHPEPAPPIVATQTTTKPDDTAQVLEAIAAGQVRPTVADIRRHLRCSQARATNLRRRIASSTATTAA